MAISLLSDTYAINLKANATTGVPEIDGVPEKNFVKGVTNSLLSGVNGGATCATGAGNTVGFLLKVAAGAKFKDSIVGLPGMSILA